MRSKSIRFMAIGLTVLATEVASAVGLSEVTVKDGVITIGTDANFPKYEGWIPWLKPYSNGHDWGTDQKAVIWTNKKLSDVKAMRCKMSGGWFNGQEFSGRALIVSRTDKEMEVQFQAQDGAYNKAVLAFLEQVGDDVVIWGRNAGYNSSSIGTPIADSCFNMQVSSSKNNGAYGVYDIEVLNVLETTPTELKEYAATVGESGTDTLLVNEGVLAIKPTVTNDLFDLNITGNASVSFVKGEGTSDIEVLNGQNLSDQARVVVPGGIARDVEVVSAKSAGAWMGVHDMSIHHLRYSASGVTFQAQRDDGNNIQSVMVEMKDSVQGIAVRYVWGRYASRNKRKVGDDFSAGEYGSVGSVYYSLSSLVLRVPPSINFSATKASWTTWGTYFEGPVRVTKQPLPANSRNVIQNGGTLRLEASAGDYNGGDSRHYEVGKDSSLVLSEGMCVTHGGSITLDGGHLDVLNDFLYVNDVTIRNGGSVSGVSPRLGWSLEGQWLIAGPDPVTIGTGFTLFNNVAKNRTIVFDVNAATTIGGSLRDDVADATFVKKGSGVLMLGAENYNNGAYRVEAGELIFANPKGVKPNNAVILKGGGGLGLAQGNDGVSAGALTLDGNAALDATNGTFAFADSRGAAWADDAVLTLKCGASKNDRKNRFRFGTTANSLTADQLSRIRYDESVTTRKVTFTLDADGYLCDSLDQGFTLRIR